MRLNLDGDLSEEEVWERQIAYLRSVLDKRLAPDSGKFGYRFKYDPDGIEHWDGLFYTIEVNCGVCSLRMADVVDGGDGTTDKFQVEQLRRLALNRIKFQAPKPSRDYVVELELSFPDLTAESLHEALCLFRIIDVLQE